MTRLVSRHASQVREASGIQRLDQGRRIARVVALDAADDGFVRAVEAPADGWGGADGREQVDGRVEVGEDLEEEFGRQAEEGTGRGFGLGWFARV